MHTQASLHISQNFTTGSAKTFLYLVQGATFDFNMLNRDYEQDLWLEKSENITLDLGVGIRFYDKRKHILAMEVLYSYGLMNVKESSENINSTKINVNDAKYYGKQINKINIHYITLQFLL